MLSVLAIALAFALTRHLLISDSILAELPKPFTEWLVATYNPQNAEEVADKSEKTGSSLAITYLKDRKT